MLLEDLKVQAEKELQGFVKEEANQATNQGYIKIKE